METEFCEQVDAYLSGEMQIQEQFAFESHLANCSICQERKKQSLALERLLYEQNTRVVMRQAFQERVLASLLETTEADLRPVVRSLRHRTDRAVAIYTVLPLSVGTAVVAALILWFALFFPNRSVDETPIPPNSNGDDLARVQIGSTPSSQAIEWQPVAVAAASGYLCARVDSEETDIEFYLVRPVLHKN